MAHDRFRAIADVWVVPRPKGTKYYKQDWTKRMFSCIVSVDPNESEHVGDSTMLDVRLEDRKTHESLAIAPYDGQHGITSVNDSARHYVITIQSRTLEAYLGIEFRNPADSIDFSSAIQTFMRRRMFADRQGWPSWSRRKTANLEARRGNSTPVSSDSSPEPSSAETSSADCSPVGSPSMYSGSLNGKASSSSSSSPSSRSSSSSSSTASPTPGSSPTRGPPTASASDAASDAKPKSIPQRMSPPPVISPPPGGAPQHEFSDIHDGYSNESNGDAHGDVNGDISGDVNGDLADEYSEPSTPSSYEGSSPVPSSGVMKSPSVTESPVDDDFGEFQTA